MAVLGFDSNYYLSTNADVLAAGIDPLTHYLNYGLNEGRSPNSGVPVIAMGTMDADTFLGGAGNDYCRAAGGNDYMLGGGGNDIMYGNRDNDTLIGGAGNDELNGNKGNDYLVGGAGNDTLNGGVDSNTLDGGAGADYLYSANGGTATVTYINSSAGVTIDLQQGYAYGGDATGDTIGEGVNHIVGSIHNDTIIAGLTPVTLEGGAGDDWIEATQYSSVAAIQGKELSADLYGGSGKDSFMFSFVNNHPEYHGNFRIMDFVRGEDVVWFPGSIHPMNALNPADFPNGFVDIMADIQNDSNGNAVMTIQANYTITIVGVSKEQLTSGDFLLTQ